MRVRHVLAFVGWYAVELLSSYRRMLLDIVAPSRNVTPSVVRYATRGTPEAHVGALGLLVTLSPGTIVLAAHAETDQVGEGAQTPDEGDVTSWTLYVHGIHHEDPEELRAWVADLERRLLAAGGRSDLLAGPGAGGRAS